jgi:hypothetical protein
LARHPLYQTIFELPTDVFGKFADAATENLTLATTRYLITMMKGALKERLLAKGDHSSTNRDAAHAFYNTGVAAPPGGFFAVREGQWLMYLTTAMRVTEHHYARLEAKLEGLASKPTVILLYNPTPYEVYRGMWTDPIPQADQVSAFQREALSAFARAHGWRFLDLTDPSRQEVQARQVWLYGQYDKGHWSSQRTAMMADVLSRELRTVIGQGEQTTMGSSAQDADDPQHKSRPLKRELKS